MPIIKSLYGQELSDVVLDEHLFDAADLNDISITDGFTAGDDVVIPSMLKPSLTNEQLKQADKVEIVKSLYGQTWVDLVLQQLGNEERLFEMVDSNDAGITDDLQAGTSIATPTLELDKKSIVNVLKGSKPASDKSLVPGATPEEGIEYWGIEYDFVVS